MSERVIKKVALLANPEREGIDAVIRSFESFLASKGIAGFRVDLTSSLSDLDIKVPECDVAVSFGGDGTVLTCAAILKGRGIPLLAVNMGSFGYIAETPVDDAQKVFSDFLQGKGDVLSRMMLDVSVIRQGKTVFSSSSLNDVTVSAVSHARMARVDLYVNDILGATLRCDGIIIATPTGSTAYSLAAGGPILDASLDAVIINPICPFTMSVRPLVVTNDSEITIKLPRQNTELSLTCDGHEVFEVGEGDAILVRQGKSRALFVQNRDRRFIEVLRDKLSWAGGFNA